MIILQLVIYGKKSEKAIQEELDKRGVNIEFDVVSNPGIPERRKCVVRLYESESCCGGYRIEVGYSHQLYE